MSYVVTGATGHLGRLIVEALIDLDVDPAQITATGRAVERLADLAARGVSTATIDYESPASMEAAFAGATTVVLVSGSELGKRVTQHANAIDAAKAAGVSRVVYTSAPHADTGALAVVPEHRATEEHLRASGLTYTIARDNWYTENYEQTFAQAAASGVVLTSAGDGRVASAPRSDYAAALAALAVSDGYENATLELSGDVAWTFDEFAAAASDVLGRPVEHRRLSPEEHTAALTSAGLDPQLVAFLVGMDADIRRGELADATDEIRTLLGRPTEPLVETLRRWV
ncbi:NAD(P)H-binding protein [Actinotalea sp. M2MS4P-6]|uniref:NAD(P)H-binding protein n=1 Tax=Actinotalea sp. M2MS4P-6 TaxID=2983762 RepID=UPI0021E3FB30|nr:NAD(P)H-binding protein [Actinotalea sp. M2MS4P-6]MCV2395393.1 NAD(P)H-binding protein [Actinotalea sp. M2MS4P-6]